MSVGIVVFCLIILNGICFNKIKIMSNVSVTFFIKIVVVTFTNTILLFITIIDAK